MADSDDPRFIIPLPGGTVARVPLSVLRSYVDPAAVSTHAGETAETTADTSSDVSEHHQSTDAMTGGTVWHLDFELGPCSFTDEAGFPQYRVAWHRHPYGTEHAVVMH
jgi:hypothetical protein